MNNRRGMIFRVLAVLLIGGLVGAGCGSSPQESLSETSVQQASSQAAPAIAEYKLADVCESDDAGVAEVAPYTQTPGIHPIVYASSKGSEYLVASDVDPLTPPSPWKPQDLAKAELVACIRMIERQIEECPYTLSDGRSATLTRIQRRVVVTLREAQTGKEVATSETMEGDAPETCQGSEQFFDGSTSKTVWGGIPIDAIHAWLKQYVEIP